MSKHLNAVLTNVHNAGAKANVPTMPVHDELAKLLADPLIGRHYAIVERMLAGDATAVMAGDQHLALVLAVVKGFCDHAVQVADKANAPLTPILKRTIAALDHALYNRPLSG